MKKIALAALAGSLAIVPGLAFAGTNTDSGPAQSGGNQTQYGQGRYLNTHSDISLNMTAACTSLSADDVAFGNVSPTTSNPSATQPMNVSWQCSPGIQPIVAFSSPNQCRLKSTVTPNSISAAGIPYHIKKDSPANMHDGNAELCNGDGSAPPQKYYPTLASESGNFTRTFTVSTDPLESGGYAIFPIGTYTDTVQVYLSF